ncbi:MAG: 6-carboxytetrahydropterin synthase [Phycisphaerae bacterium]|nr:6-carboxytetrahydropterin synthase [Phycisphaerae bacterium]
MYTVAVTSRFQATHALRMYDGMSEPIHEHEWCVRACFAGHRLDEVGLVVDFTYVRKRMGEIGEKLAGTCLNEWPALEGGNPSAERVATAFFQLLSADTRLSPILRGVFVTETPGCEAGYAPGGFIPGLMDGRIIDDKTLER